MILCMRANILAMLVQRQDAYTPECLLESIDPVAKKCSRPMQAPIHFRPSSRFHGHSEMLIFRRGNHRAARLTVVATTRQPKFNPRNRAAACRETREQNCFQSVHYDS